MTDLFPIVIYVVAAVGILLSLTRLAWPFSAAERTGRIGTWISHIEDVPTDQGPDPCVNDDPIPFRRLRPRR